MANDRWMAPFTNRNNLTLADITIPASHDAGVSDVHNLRYTGRIGPEADTICQEFDIGGQLSEGSRFFDLRIAPHGGTLKTFHGGNAAGRWGQDAASVFQQVKNFLDANDSEIVILRISHTKESANVGDCVIANITGGRLYTSGPQNLAKRPLSSLRGKAIAIFADDALGTASPGTGLHRFTKYDDYLVGPGLTICGSYAGVNADLREMVQKGLECGNAHGGHMRITGKHNHLFMVYWQLAYNVRQKAILNGAQRPVMPITRLDDDQGVHYNLDYLLNAHRGLYAMHQVSFRAKKKLKIGKKVVSTNVTQANRLYHRPNIINLDFVNEEVCNRVIAFNNFLLPP